LGNWRLQGGNKEAAEYVQKLLDTAKKTKPHPDYKKDKSMDMYYILHKMVEGQKTDRVTGDGLQKKKRRSYNSVTFTKIICKSLPNQGQFCRS
jgi:hypothetical protein